MVATFHELISILPRHFIAELIISSHDIYYACFHFSSAIESLYIFHISRDDELPLRHFRLISLHELRRH